MGAIQYGILELKGNDWVDMSPFAYCVSITAFVLLIVVMMNLLIAIVSATFERVTSSSVQYSFKEKVGLVSDIYAALKMFVRKESPNKG